MSKTIPTAALDKHIAILGKTGSGKTYAAKGIVEHLLDQRRQVCVLDPTSAWWGLRLGADGKKRGFEIVLLGGKHADIPLAEKSGAAVARLVTGQGASVVLDTSGMTVGEYTRWFIDFAGTLYTTVRSPLHLVIDEAHYFMPQGGGGRLDVDAGRMLHAGNRLMSGGRSLGIRGVMITQRPAKLHKDALTCADTLIAMRVIAPQDRAAVKDWIDGAGDPAQGKEVLDSLAQLGRGEGWVWYPEGGYLERTKFPAIKTYDSSATPEHGARSGPDVSAINLEEVRGALAEAVREAEANDPTLLRRRIAELEKQVKAKPAEKKVEKVVERVEVPVLKNGQLDKALKLVEQLKPLADTFQRAVNILDTAARQPMGMASGRASIVGRAAAPPLQKPSRDIPRPIPGRSAVGRDLPSDLDRPCQAILDTVITLQCRGIQANRDSVARWLAIHPNGGRYGSNLHFLREQGYLDGFTLTEKGAAAARMKTTGYEAALDALPDEPKKAILRTLAEAGRPLSREELAEMLGIHPNGGRYGSNLHWLRQMGVIPDRGPIVPTEGVMS